MTPLQFATAWESEGDRLNRYPLGVLGSISLAPGDLEFLTNAGLPDSAAPFLGFDTPSDAIPTLSEEWSLPPEFNRYRSIGCNGSGDPICIDESARGQIVLLNHDNDFAVTIMNTSAEKLAHTLLAFRTLVRETDRRLGPDAYLNNDIPDDLVNAFEAAVHEIDPPALAYNTFWSGQIEQLRLGPDEI